MTQTIQAERAALHSLPGTRNFERCFHSSVESSACFVAIEEKRAVVRHKKVWDQWIATRSERRFPEITCLIVVGRAKADAGDDAQPSKVSVGVKELVKSIESPAFVVVIARTAWKVEMQVSNTGFALVEDWTSKNGRTGYVQHDFGKTLRLLKETVSLK